VAVAVAASALTNVVVFTPIAFMEGIIGQFFFAFGLTVVFATLTSVLISFTLAPMLAARLLRANETRLEEEGWLGFIWKRFDAGYAGPGGRVPESPGVDPGSAPERLGHRRWDNPPGGVGRVRPVPVRGR
jgi:hypothetical protein